MNADEAEDDLEMKPEYDFTGGIRGRHYRAYREGHTVLVTEDDGRVYEHHFGLEDGAVLLDPDLRAEFPNSEAVNNALRSLLTKA